MDDSFKKIIINTGLRSTSVDTFLTPTNIESYRGSPLVSSTKSIPTSTIPYRSVSSTPTSTDTIKHSTTSGSSASLSSTAAPIQSTKCEIVCLEALSSTLGEIWQC